MGTIWEKLFKKREQPVNTESITKNVEKEEKKIEEIKKSEKVEKVVVDNWMRRMLSHNVRMPMSVISGYGELLKQDLLTEKEKEECIGVICENITYLNQCLSVILDEDMTEIKYNENTDIVAIAHKMKKYVHNVATKIPVSIEIQAREPKMMIHVPSVPVMRVFYQLYENAFKYLGRGNKITISIHNIEEEQVMVVFKDDGKGMEKEEFEHIFEQGFRGSNSQNKAGTGFGLYGVKQIVEQYGGQISASGGINKGFSVIMIFPMMKEKEGCATDGRR